MASEISTNAISFIGLCSEYCTLLENAKSNGTETEEFVKTTLKLLPRIYICAFDLPAAQLGEECEIASNLTEDYYDDLRVALEGVLGENDTYLEVFEQDMKFSDTPIAASVAEGLSDIFQVLYNFLSTVKDAPQYVVEGALYAVKDDFTAYWSQTLCNVLRALNHIYFNREA